MELKLGKLPAVEDPLNRTIPLSAILIPENLPPLPAAFDVDDPIQSVWGGVDDHFVYRNAGPDAVGDCVKAARAHHTLRLEMFEQKKQIEITDDEVVAEYFRESGGRDTGLILLNAMKDWRKQGWDIGGKHYTIYAFAKVDWKDHDQVKHAIHLLAGINFGMLVFTKDIEQFQNGQGWRLTGQDGKFRGGHGVYGCKYRDQEQAELGRLLAIRAEENGGHAWLPRPDIIGYEENGLWVMTWGVKQFMTWAFWDARVDEAYAVVDQRNDWQGKDSPLDIDKLDAYLELITGDKGIGQGCNPFSCLIPERIKEIRF